MSQKKRGVRVDVHNFVDARVAKGLTQDELADAAGVSRNTIARAEAGLPISIDSLRRIAPQVDKSYDWLRLKIEGSLTIPEKSPGIKEVIEELKKDRELRALLLEELRKMIDGEDPIDPAKVDVGSLKIIFHITPADARRLIRNIERAKAKAKTNLDEYTESIWYGTVFNPRNPEREAWKLIMAAIESISEVHIPENEYTGEMHWSEGGDRRVGSETLD